jgi:hypothetical protein
LAGDGVRFDLDRARRRHHRRGEVSSRDGSGGAASIPTVAVAVLGQLEILHAGVGAGDVRRGLFQVPRKLCSVWAVLTLRPSMVPVAM